MQLQARLVHAEAQQRVVLVAARDGERLLGSALGEGANAEEAEDRALARLLARLQPSTTPSAPAPSAAPLSFPTAPVAPPAPSASQPPPTVRAPTPSDSSASPPSPQRPASPLPPELPAALEPPVDPEDWSTELARLDLEIGRLGWSRELEAVYLERAFGHPSRHRITIYADLLAYLRAIEGLAPGSDPSSAPLPLRRTDLLSQGERMLERLGWDGQRARRFLEGKLGVSSRQQLNDEQLLQFNLELESELISTGR